MLVSQHEVRIEVFHRGANGTWQLSEAGPGEAIQLRSIDVKLHVDDVYHDPLTQSSEQDDTLG